MLTEAKRQWTAKAEAIARDARNNPQEVVEPLEALLREVRTALADHPEDPELRRIEARVRFAEATLHTQQSRFWIAEQNLRALLQEYEDRDDPHEVSRCLHALSIVRGRQGDDASALEFLERCFHLQRQHGAPLEKRARTVMNIGITQAVLEQHHTALETLQFATELFGETNEEALGIIRTNEALIHRSLEQHDESRRLLQSAVSILQKSGSSVHLINALLETANGDIQRNALDDAEGILKQLPAMIAKNGMVFFEPEVQLVSARLWLARGCPAEAQRTLDAALPQCANGQRSRLLALRVEAAEAAEQWKDALKWERIAHREQLEQIEAHHKARLAAAQTHLVDTIEAEQRDWLRAELQRAHSDARDLTTQLKHQKTMLATTAHDINNPLSVVLLLSELASSTPDSLHESAESIVEAARHMRELVTHLLESARQPRAEPALHIDAVPLQPLLDAVYARYGPMATGKNQRFTCAPAPPGCVVQGDRKALQRILDNLVSNAIKYTPATGTIELRTQHRTEHIVLEVLDTGPGLSPADLQRVFLYPQRLSAVPTNGEEQHGLGLVSVRRLVTAMGGRVHAENRLREGARFVVHLLAAEPPGPTPT